MENQTQSPLQCMKGSGKTRFTPPILYMLFVDMYQLGLSRSVECSLLLKSGHDWRESYSPLVLLPTGQGYGYVVVTTIVAFLLHRCTIIMN